MTKFATLLLLLFTMHTTMANVQLPKVFSDHMVLQRDKNITIWGWAAAKEKVTVQFNKQSKSVVAGKDGQWKVILNPEVAGGPYQLVVKGKNTITLSDILMGDVWICSGQSNMEWSVSASADPANEIKAGNYPTIRHIKIPNVVAGSPQADIKSGAWEVCSPSTVGNFTAVGYYFARTLTKELNVPIGLINTSWGGTHVETWTSRSAFEGNTEFAAMIKKMPRINMDSLSKQKVAQTLKRIEGIQGKLPTNVAEAEAWKNTTFNDASWSKMNIPEMWEGQALGDLDGVVWLRKSIDVPAEDAGKVGTLELGMIDDIDETYVNGVKVGGAGQWNLPRLYTIPAGTLTAGKNTIAIRITDTGGGGGLYGDAAHVTLKVGNTTLPLAGAWSYKVESILTGPAGVGPNAYPTLLFNAMINPLLPLGVKGALWYQGEANTGRAYQYRKAFPLMIADWRKQWAQGDFPFYFVQLATFGADHGTSEKGSTWAELREAQTQTLSVPNTGMVVTTDIGDVGDIHPRNKQDVGSRLAAVALSKTYGKNIVASGPTYQAIKVDGNKIIVSFTNIGKGLITKDRYGYVKGFEIAGADKKFTYAKASIEGDHLVVYSESVAAPVAVRYGWADDASDDNLFNKDGFPASPFRSDDWKGVTEGAKFDF